MLFKSISRIKAAYRLGEVYSKVGVQLLRSIDPHNI